MSIEQARAYVGLFDPFRLRVARAFAGLRKTELARRIDKTPAALTQYESGNKVPNAATLASLSFTLGFPVEFFAKDGRRISGLDLGDAFFRSLRSTRRLDRDRAVAQALFVSELSETMQRHVRLPAPNLPYNLHVSENADRETIERSAWQLRAYWNVPDGPIANMVRLLEANGLLVTRCRFDGDDVSAFSRYFRQGPVVVIDSDQEHVDRVRFTAAHELGHLVLHSEVEAANRILEQQADRFASSFLMPRHLIYDHLPTRLNFMQFYEVKKMWGVSISALLFRARELGRISEATYRRGVMIMNAQGQRKNESAFPLSSGEKATLFLRAMQVMAEKGHTLQSLAKEARLPESLVENIISGHEDPLPEVRIPTHEDVHPVFG